MAHVFLYGTLMRGHAAHRALGLPTALAYVGDACIAGRVYRVADYPGLCLGSGEAWGELFRIVDPAVLARMDAYEDCDPDTAGGPEYARRLVQVPGHAVQAWTYEYVRPLHREQVVEGKWRVSPSA